MSDNNKPSLSELCFYFFRLAWVGFGGPLAHISLMQQDTVEKRRWLTQEEFVEMLGMTNMLPGPNSTELAIHIGYLKGGRIGAIVSGLAFTLPSFFIMLVLAWLYFQIGSIPSVSGIFYGINPAVIVIIVLSALRLGKSSVVDIRSIGIAASVFFAILLTDVNEAIVLLAAGLTGILLYSPRIPSRLSALLLLFPPSALGMVYLSQIPLEFELFLLFLKTGSLLFGTGLVIVPLIAHDIVEVFGWMSYKQFFDGVALGQVTPGPVVKTATFVGYGVAGVLGAGVATLGVFLPPFAIVILLAPLIKKMKANRLLQDFLKGIRPGAVGAILAAAALLGQAALVDIWAIAIAVASFIALAKFRASIPLTIIACMIIGVTITLIQAGILFT